ncbi:MAG: zinc finger domain-containing protein [Candidatus Thermoplasmatota archaeon]|nr:zinc finger domain-containing protein [Candidatus Thermoplasmatota archaeon]
MERKKRLNNMLPIEDRCTSCGTPIQAPKSVKFKCPKCNDAYIVRCGQCRDQSANYICPACGFIGP